MAVDAAHLGHVSGLGSPNQLEGRFREKTTDDAVPGVRACEQRIGRPPVAAVADGKVVRGVLPQTSQLALTSMSFGSGIFTALMFGTAASASGGHR